MVLQENTRGYSKSFMSSETIADSKKIECAKEVKDFISSYNDRLNISVLKIISDAFESELSQAGIKFEDPYWTRSKYSVIDWNCNDVWFDLAHYDIHSSCTLAIENIMVRYVDLYNYLQWECRIQKSITNLQATFDDHFSLYYPGKTWDEKSNMVSYESLNDNGGYDDKFVFRDFARGLHMDEEGSLCGVSSAIEAFNYVVREELKVKVGEGVI